MHRIFSIIAIALICTSGYGARKYGMAGCGLGTFVVDPDSSGFAQAFAATTNGTAYSQIGGIISGTSNCVPDEGEKKAMNQEQFVLHNLASLAKEITQGEGETLSAFTEELGCSASISTAVKSELKSNAGIILAAPGAIAVLESAKEMIRSKPEISKHCSLVG